MDINVKTCAFAGDVTSSKTREEARAKILRRKLLAMYKETIDHNQLISQLIGSTSEIQRDFKIILIDVEVTLQAVEAALIQELQIFFKELRAEAWRIAHDFKKSPHKTLRRCSHIYDFSPVGPARNAYLLEQVPEYALLAKVLSSVFINDGITAQICMLDAGSEDEPREDSSELRFVITKLQN